MNRYISVSTDKTKQSFGKRPMEFANRPKFPFALREMRGWDRVLVEFGLLVGFWMLGAVIGPFGTFLELTFTERLIYWGFMTAVNWAQVRLALILLSQPFLLRFQNFWTLIIGASALASVPATFEVIWLEDTFRTHKLGFFVCYIYVFLLTLAITGPVTRIFFWADLKAAEQAENEQTGAVTPVVEKTGDAPCRFLARLPAELGRDIICVGSEDHYVRVYTRAGDDLILLRFSDAVAELADNDALPGMQVHRSWWVADAGRAGVVREGRKILLSLKNDMQVPVSRSFQPAVREAGWLSMVTAND